MTDHSRSFVINVYGIENKDKDVLKRILAITASRARSYILQDEQEGQPDIVMLNIANREAIEKWSDIYIDKDGRRLCPTILIGEKSPKKSKLPFAPLPFFASRVLKILDEVTVKELKYTPELEIDNPNNKNSSSDETDRNINKLTSQDLEGILQKKNEDHEANKKAKVLVVDDSLPVRKALDMKLRLMDYEVQQASSGQQALWMLKNNMYDSIFLDVVMPGIDGYEVCKQVKRNKATKHIPVIMLTSKSSPFDKVKGKLAGCDTYLTKPVGHDEFQKVVAGYLQ